MDGEILTLAQIEGLLRDDGDRLARAEQRLTQARQTHASAVARYGSADESATATAVRAEQDAILAAVERDVAGTAEAARRNAQAVLRQLERAAGPVLSPEDTQRAAAVLAEIKEDSARLDAVALRDRLAAAVTLGDRASMHHFARYVPLRSLDEDTGRTGEREAVAEIPRLLAAMKDALRNPALDPHLARARTVIGGAADLHAGAMARQHAQEADEAVFTIMGNRRGVNIAETLAALGQTA